MKRNYKSRSHKVKRVLLSRPCGLIICMVQFIITVIFLYGLLHLNILPLKYFLLAAVIVLLLFLLPFSAQASRRFRNPFKIVSILISVLLMFVSCKYVMPLSDIIEGITGGDTKKSVASVYVVSSDPAQSLSDMKEYSFGYLGGVDKKLSDIVISDIEGKIGSEIKKTQYDNYEVMVKDLFSGTVDAIILNQAYESLIVDPEMHLGMDDSMAENFKNFVSVTRKITSVTHTEKVDVEKVDKNPAEDAFIMYVSGIDVYGSISTTSRSDVNILAVVNPKTRQILLLNTPRDSFVHNMHSGSERDKLTHAAIYGIDSSIDALEKLYGIDVDYFFRVNFTGFVKIIDELGGIDVYSEYAFTSDFGYSFKKGTNRLNGEKALVFCRERHAFSAGDRQRGKNQMAVITALINSLASSSMLYNYNDVINSLRGTFETSMSSGDISALIKSQLNNMSGWSISNYSVDGDGSMEHTFTAPPGEKRWVMLLDENTINEAKQLIQKVIDGEILKP